MCSVVNQYWDSVDDGNTQDCVKFNGSIELLQSDDCGKALPFLCYQIPPSAG